MPTDPPPLFPTLDPKPLTAVGARYMGALLVVSALPRPATPLHAGAQVAQALANALGAMDGLEALAWHRLANEPDAQHLRDELDRLHPRRVVFLGEEHFRRVERELEYQGVVTAPAEGVADLGRLGGALTVVAVDGEPHGPALAALCEALVPSGGRLPPAQRRAFELLSGFPWDGVSTRGAFVTDRPYGDTTFTGPPWGFRYEVRGREMRAWLERPGGAPEVYALAEDGDLSRPHDERRDRNDPEAEAEAWPDEPRRGSRKASSRRIQRVNTPDMRRPRR